MPFVPATSVQDPLSVRLAAPPVGVCAGCGAGLVELPRAIRLEGRLIAYAHTASGEPTGCRTAEPVECRAVDCALPAAPSGGPWCVGCG